MSDTLLVRIPPYNPALGHFICERTIVTPGWTQQFKAGKWYEVNRGVCEAVLRHERQRAGDIGSQPAFQIVTQAEAKSIVREEELAKMGRLEKPLAPPRPSEEVPPIEISESPLNEPKLVHELQLPREPTAFLNEPVVEPEPVRIPEVPNEDAIAAEPTAPMEIPDMSDLPGAPKPKPKAKRKQKRTSKAK